jgi:hypothetical protein
MAGGVVRASRAWQMWVLVGLLLAPLAGRAVASEAGSAGPRPAASGGPVFEQALQEEQREAEREAQWRTSPEGEEEREQSREEYRDLSGAQARTTYQEQFPEVAAEPAFRPLRFADGAESIRYLSDLSAIVAQREGEPGVLVTSNGFPLRVEDESGGKVPVDLKLEHSGDGFTPEAAVVDTRIGERLGDGVQVDGLGLDYSGDGTVAGVAENGQVTYPNIEVDTDRVIMATPLGVESYSLLRSPESPEVERIAVDVPAGALLRATDSGGAEIVRDETVLTAISAAQAVDAQDAPVPTAMRVEGGRW